jgi:hypothetical protein
MSEDLNLLADMVAFGDGGFFCNRIVTPVFDVMAYEVGAGAGGKDRERG